MSGVNQFSPNQHAPILTIIEGLKAAGDLGIIGAHAKAQNLANALAESQGDANSDASKGAQKSALLELGAIKQSGILDKTPGAYDDLAKQIGGTPAVPGSPAQNIELQGPVQPGAAPPAKTIAAVPETPAQPGMSYAALKGDASPLNNLTKLAAGKYSADASANRFAGLIGVKQGQLDETKSKNAGQVGQEFENNGIIKLSKGNLNSLTRSQSILENPDKPVTTKDLNLAYNDYINAVAAGGAATEGKIHRELPDTFDTQWNDLKAKFGEFDDLRNDATGKQLISMLTQNIGTVRKDIDSAIGQQALDIHDSNKQSTNQQVKDTIKDKLKRYNPVAYGQIYGGAQSSGTAPPGAAPKTEQAPASKGSLADELRKRGAIK